MLQTHRETNVSLDCTTIILFVFSVAFQKELSLVDTNEPAIDLSTAHNSAALKSTNHFA